MFICSPGESETRGFSKRVAQREQQQRPKRETPAVEQVDGGGGGTTEVKYQQLSVQQHPGLGLQNFAAVDDFHRRAAAQTLEHSHSWSESQTKQQPDGSRGTEQTS